MTPAEMSRLLWEGRRPARGLTREDVPAHRGLYVWYSISSDAVLYVGKATGEGGLRRRIYSQHLNPKYLESRPEKLRAADEFQRSCGVMASGRICVDKSVFRRSLGRRFRLVPGVGTVQYIRDNLAVAWLTADQLGDIPKAERDLIRELKPILNVNGVSRSPEDQG
jgi:hypothetical protein